MSELYNEFNVTFKNYVETPESIYFAYKGVSRISEKKEYVSGNFSLTLLETTYEPEADGCYFVCQRWQWQMDILQNNKKAYLKGTTVLNYLNCPDPDNPAPAPFPYYSPDIIWFQTLLLKQKTVCSLTLNESSAGSEVGQLWAAGTNPNPGAGILYLYIIN